MFKTLEVHIFQEHSARFGRKVVERHVVHVGAGVGLAYRAGGVAYDVCCRHNIHVDFLTIFCDGRRVEFELPVVEL